MLRRSQIRMMEEFHKHVVPPSFHLFLLPSYSCPHIKKDGSVCGRVCTRLTGCSIHWKSGANKLLKSPCRICDRPTLSYTGLCSKHANKFYRRAERERQRDVLSHITRSL